MLFFSIAFAVIGVAGAVLLNARRRLLALDARCVDAAADVEAASLRLHSLFPALVGLMRAFAPQERVAIDAVATAYAGARRAHSPQARLFGETRLADGVHALLGRAQGVPQIQTLDDFRELRIRMDEAERQLAAARRGLKAATDAYNEALCQFPESLFAVRLRLAPRPFYDIGEEQPDGEGSGPTG
ncbi:LemA family protein [Methylocystis sp. IM3]|uniref:LemA family protein n=1 Tax=unclassified Methylocystis TaxID=2625913 RepID=UPI0030F84EFA